MAPSVTIDNTPDFDMDFSPPTNNTAAKQTTSTTRTLLLSPPSLSAHPEALTNILAAHDRTATDIQMLDRLALGLVSLPPTTYDLVLLLTDVDGARSAKLDRALIELLAQSLKAEGRLEAQNGALDAAEQTEGILAGLLAEGAGLLKPKAVAEQTVKLSFGKKKKADAAAVPANAVEAVNTGKRKSADISNGVGSAVPVKATPAGVGFVELGDEFGMDYDEDEDIEIPSNEELERAERIDPDSLLTEEDRQKPLNIRKSLPCKTQDRTSPLLPTSTAHITNTPPSRSLQTQHQAPPRLQRLQLRSGGTLERRRRRQTRQRRRQPGQTQQRRPGGGGFHGAGQGGFLRELRAGRRV